MSMTITTALGTRARLPLGPRSVVGHSRPGKASIAFGHVRYTAKSGIARKE
jgi:hypothetical protein